MAVFDVQPAKPTPTMKFKPRRRFFANHKYFFTEQNISMAKGSVVETPIEM
jgi:hypothetical protein